MNKNRNDLTVLKLIFTGIQFKEWHVNSFFAGYKLTDDLGGELKYALSPRFWNTSLVPGLEWAQAILPSPEARMKQMINRYFSDVDSLIKVNDWLYPSYSIKDPNSGSTILCFSISGINSHHLSCPYKLGDNNMISCRQLLELHRSEFTKVVVRKINNTLKAILGEKQYREFRDIPIEDRPRAYLRANKEFID